MPIGLSLIMLGVFPHCLTVYIRSASGREHGCDGLMLNPSFFVCLSKHIVTDNVSRVEQIFFTTCCAYCIRLSSGTFSSQEAIVFRPRAMSLISGLLSPRSPGSKRTRVNIKISRTETVSNVSTLSYNQSYHFELVHRKALYFPKQNWFGLL